MYWSELNYPIYRKGILFWVKFAHSFSYFIDKKLQKTNECCYNTYTYTDIITTRRSL